MKIPNDPVLSTQFGRPVRGRFLPSSQMSPPPKRLPVGSCDWGSCDEDARGVRWGGNKWFAVCEGHLQEAPNGEWLRLKR